MNLTKINLYLYRTIGILIVIFLLLGSIGIILNRLYLKGAIGLSAAIIISWFLFKAPSMRLWGIILGVLLASMFFVGLIDTL
jgi:uncharacterized MnhB-related membrane protein